MQPKWLLAFSPLGLNKPYPRWPVLIGQRIPIFREKSIEFSRKFTLTRKV
jgi:hypothetical protein